MELPEWTVITEPRGDNPDDGHTVADRRNKNTSGLAVVLTDGDIKHECSRVAFVRENSRHPDTPFEVQLQIELDKAEEAAATLNEMLVEFEAIRMDAQNKARERIREILGDEVPALA